MRSCSKRDCAGATKKPGSASGSIPSSAKKGAIEPLYTAPPVGSVVICLDEMGPVSAKSYPGRQPLRTDTCPAGRARQEIDYGRRGKG